MEKIIKFVDTSKVFNAEENTFKMQLKQLAENHLNGNIVKNRILSIVK